ncbi:hypothetical protein EES44_17000 [Streptomyces sp. ADI96-15]|nr:hypothetical protein EES44_17000 [Streptomyces sp. ADI96-15]
MPVRTGRRIPAGGGDDDDPLAHSLQPLDDIASGVAGVRQHHPRTVLLDGRRGRRRCRRPLQLVQPVARSVVLASIRCRCQRRRSMPLEVLQAQSGHIGDKGSGFVEDTDVARERVFARLRLQNAVTPQLGARPPEDPYPIDAAQDERMVLSLFDIRPGGHQGVRRCIQNSRVETVRVPVIQHRCWAGQSCQGLTVAQPDVLNGLERAVPLIAACRVPRVEHALVLVAPCACLDVGNSLGGAGRRLARTECGLGVQDPRGRR